MFTGFYLSERPGLLTIQHRRYTDNSIIFVFPAVKIKAGPE